MTDEDDTPRTAFRWIREHLSMFIGVLGLLAWFFMLWLMFGDVL